MSVGPREETLGGIESTVESMLLEAQRSAGLARADGSLQPYVTYSVVMIICICQGSKFVERKNIYRIIHLVELR